jgi:CheY-like chemotaxis protein
MAAASERAFHVLLVDDSAVVCERLSALIHQLGDPIRVAVAAEGGRALAFFEELCPDAVVLDLELSGLIGFDRLVEFKRRRAGCVVIILTTYTYPEFRENAVRLGADHFFSKTMEFERVTEVLGTLTDTIPRWGLTPWRKDRHGRKIPAQRPGSVADQSLR